MSITEGKWKQIKGKVRERWGDITDDEYDETKGQTEQLAGKIEEKYGHSREDVRQELDRMRDDDKQN